MSSNLFDVTMGSYDGAESCELDSAYLLHSIKEKFGNPCSFGLYRDDGLGITKASPRKTELIKKRVVQHLRQVRSENHNLGQ